MKLSRKADRDNGVESKNRTSKKAAIRARLQAAVQAEWPTLAVGTSALLVSSLSNQALLRGIGRLIDNNNNKTYSSSSSSSSSTYAPLAVIVLGGGLASCLRTMTLQTAQARISASLRMAAFEALMRTKNLEWFQQPTITTKTQKKPTKTHPDDTSDEDNVNNATKQSKDATDETETAPETDSSSASAAAPPGAAATLTILTQDVPQIAATLTTTLANIVRSTSSVIFSTYTMLSLNPALLGVAVTVVPVVGAAAMGLRSAQKKTAAVAAEQTAAADEFVQERLRHIATVRHCHRERDECQRYRQTQEQLVRTFLGEARQAGGMMGFLFAATSSALLLVVHVGNRSVQRGNMTGGQLTAFATSSFLLGLGTSGLMKGMGEAMAGLMAAERYYDLITADKDDHRHGGGGGDDDDDPVETGLIHIPNVDRLESITVSNVDFYYQSSPHKRVLRDVSFTLRRGQVCALVGKNGCGKSTMTTLLSGLHRPVSGSIQIQLEHGDMNGHGNNESPCIIDLNRLDRDTHRRLVQVIPQSPALFNTSILENVRYANPDASEQAVRYALAEANCTDFVSQLADGLHTVVGRNGGKLSGGQRQRLALARALLADPAVLILDEPTTSLDSEGTAAVLDAVTTGRDRNRIVLLITHQVKTLELADTVLVLANLDKDGSTNTSNDDEASGGARIVEVGSLSELRANPDSELNRLMPSLLRQEQELQGGSHASSSLSTSSLF